MVSLSEFSRGFSPSSNLESFFGVKNAFFSGSSSSDFKSEPTVPSASLVLLTVELEVWLLDRLQKKYMHMAVFGLVRTKKYLFRRRELSIAPFSSNFLVLYKLLVRYYTLKSMTIKIGYLTFMYVCCIVVSKYPQYWNSRHYCT